MRLEAERRDARIAKYRAALAGRGAPVRPRRGADHHVRPTRCRAALASLPAGARLVLDPAADRGALPAADDVTIISGPEGGLAPDELDALAAAGFTSLGLGPRVLRAETAPVVAVALIRAATAS